MQATLDLEADTMSFSRPSYLERIDWKDGTRSYCRSCDKQVPFKATGRSSVACENGHNTHPANLLLNGMKA